MKLFLSFMLLLLMFAGYSIIRDRAVKCGPDEVKIRTADGDLACIRGRLP